MSPEDPTAPASSADPHQQLRHELKTPLTTAYARTQLVARIVRRSTGLTERERSGMLDGLGIVEQALRAMIPLIDEIGRDSPDGGTDAG